MFRYASIILCLFALHAPSMDDTLGRGRQRVTFHFGFLEGDTYFDYLEEEIPVDLGGGLLDYETDSIIAEYLMGWTDDMTVVFRTQHLSRSLTAGDSLSNSGISGYYLGLRQRLNRRGGTVRFLAETGLLVNEKGDDLLPLSTSGTDFFAIASYNQVFPRGGAVEMDIGYRLRGGGAADEMFVDAALRFKMRRILDGKLFYHTLESLEDEKVIYSFLEYPNERGEQRFGLELSRRLGKRWNVGLGYESVFGGRNTYKTSGMRLSISWWM
ncbi:MAG: hypothetical protein QNK37_15405 [Acidobacteriota bacterium]|nr:hypothetical protein [Acidobacteriota bacterium]